MELYIKRNNIVIIGITIAFSMNKCADNLRDNKLKKEYLINLKRDFEADKVQLDKNYIDIEKKLRPVLKLSLHSKSEQNKECL